MSESWSGILDGDEKSLWQRRPDARWVFEPQMLSKALFNLIFAWFSVYWMSLAAASGTSFWLFGLPFLGVGLSVSACTLFGPTIVRAFSWCALTDRCALIATKLPFTGRKPDSDVIPPDTNLPLVEGDRSSLHFASRSVMAKTGGRSVPIGFERIDDGRAVYTLFVDGQGGRTRA